MNAEFFASNRARLSTQCDGAIILTAYVAVQMTGDVAAPFRQEANFWYLTGIKEPGWQVIITPDKSWLVAPTISDAHRVFDGGLSPDEAQRISGVDAVIDQSEVKELLATLATKYDTVYGLDRHPHDKYYGFERNPAPDTLWRQLKRQFKDVRDVRGDIVRLRAIKQQVELDAMTKAINLTVEAFRNVKEQLATYEYEYQIEADFTHIFRRVNARHAYEPIVASGVNACTLHYDKNEAGLKDSDLVLLDIGAQVEGYPADITRTYSVGGRPSTRQHAVHAAVRDAHTKIVELLQPGVSFEQYQKNVDEIMKSALRSLDLLRTTADYRRYFPHAISHGLGIDVHDSLGGFETFHPGMVLTVEPGIYIPEEGIGVRLEDDIIITESGYVNTSDALSLEL